MRRSGHGFCSLAAIILLAHSLAAVSQPSAGGLAQVEELQNTLTAIAETVRPSVVAVRAQRPILTSERAEDPEENLDPAAPPDPVGSAPVARLAPAVGSGIIIHPDGLVLTNEHVVHRARPEDITCVLSNGEAYQVQEVTIDPRRDLAVLRIDAKGLKPARLGNADTVRQGHFAIVMGNPFGSASEAHGRPVMSFGIVSALGCGLTRQLDPLLAERYYGNLIQTDARINPGNSGGPLLNIHGEVIGINTAIATRSGGSEGVGYAIPLCPRTKEIIELLAKGEEVDYGFLGVDLGPVEEPDRRAAGAPSVEGAVVKSVEFGTPAAEAHLQTGDVVVAFAGQKVADPDELIAMVGAAAIGRPVNLTVYRDQRVLTIPVVPARRKMPPPNTFAWRGMKLAEPDWEVCKTLKLPVETRGAVVTQVEATGSAAQAGLKPGQVIIRIGETPILGIRKLPRITAKLAGPVRVTVAAEPPAERILP